MASVRTTAKESRERNLEMNRVLKLALMLFCLISLVGVSASEAEDEEELARIIWCLPMKSA